ncbi:MAG: Asp-tRNA(Asn)/Glu-tRNA(Gln) amidotransferase subunit GatC [Gemmatimonadaceae bacterium]
MAEITRDDVRHIAGLARIGVPDERLDALVGELNGILAHMEVLQRVPSAGAAVEAEALRTGMPLRADQGPSVRLERPIAAFAPATRALDGAPMPSVIDGFFLVPRLATHEDAGDES